MVHFQSTERRSAPSRACEAATRSRRYRDAQLPTRDHSLSFYSVTGDGGQYFRVRPSNSSVLEGGEVVIPCEVGNRVGTVQWVKDGFAYVIQESKFKCDLCPFDEGDVSSRLFVKVE